MPQSLAKNVLFALVAANVVLHTPTHAHINEHIDSETEDGQSRKLNAVAGESLNLGIDESDLPPSVRAKLPSAKNVNNLYGSEPVILGLDRCEDFRETYAPEDRFIAIAGLYNTGTNILSFTLRDNCIIPGREESYAKYGKKGEIGRGILPGVHWGKHGPPSLQSSPYHILPKYEGLMDFTKYDFMPVVIVKDPIFWMASMCKRWYDVLSMQSDQSLYERCPYLSLDENGTPIPVKGRLSPWGQDFEYNSLVDMWNEFYQAYIDYETPRLIVRYEDLLFHGETVTKQICSCAGGTVENFSPWEKSTKSNVLDEEGQAHGWIDSAILYGNPDKRNKVFKLERDRVFAETHLNDKLMNLFHYQLQTIPNTDKQAKFQEEVPHILWFVAPKDTLTEVYFHSVVATIDAYKEHWNEPDAEVNVLSHEDCQTLVSNLVPDLQYVFSSDDERARQEDVCQLAALYKYGGYAFTIHVETMQPFVPKGGVTFVTSVACMEEVDGAPSSCRMSTSFKASTPDHVLVKQALDAYAATYQENALWDPATQVQLEMARAYQVELFQQDQQERFPLVEFPLDDPASMAFEESDTKERVSHDKMKRENCDMVVRNTNRPSEAYFLVHDVRAERCGKETRLGFSPAK